MTMYQPIIRITELKNALIRFRVVETALDTVIIFLSSCLKALTIDISALKA